MPKNIHIISPGFKIADCLETLEELEEENKYFMEAGGEQYVSILNDDQKHLNFISNLVLKHTQGWNIS